jgi:hypothetical protein
MSQMKMEMGVVGFGMFIDDTERICERRILYMAGIQVVGPAGLGQSISWGRQEGDWENVCCYLLIKK